MSLVEFELPSAIQETSYEKILAEMLRNISERYDKTEGGFVFDMIAPSALEAAELVQFWLALGIKMNFHMFASGRWLDYHASDCGLERKPATHATGEVQITTDGKVTFQKGFIFSVPSENGSAAIDFETTEAATINGTGSVKVQAVLAGVSGNVASESISIMKNPVNNVMRIGNSEATAGGVEAESDEDLRKRIDDFYAGRSSSFVGNCADYRRWALSVPGVGFAHVIPTAPLEKVKKVLLYDAEDKLLEDAALTARILKLANAAAVPNSVRIVLADPDGAPATSTICQNVEKFIFGESHSDLNRLAPIGVVSWSVEPFKEKKIGISMNATLSEAESVVKARAVSALGDYFKSLADDDFRFGVLRYVAISAVLSQVEGLDDFKKLRVNGSLDNVTFAEDEIPTVGEITFN